MDNELAGDEPMIDLVREEMRELASSVIDATSETSPPFGTYLFRSDEPGAQLGRYIEDTVFAEWFGNSAELLDAEYDAYDPSTYFIVILDHVRSLPAGTIRINVPSELGLKTLSDIESVWGARLDTVLAETGLAWDERLVWDVATSAVHADYRGKATDGMISLALYQAVVRSLRAAGARWFVCVLDMHVMRLMQEMTSAPFYPFAGVEPVRYLDSPASNAFWCDFEEYEPRLQLADPFMHGVLFRGEGIEAVVREATTYAVSQELAERFAGRVTTR